MSNILKRSSFQELIRRWELVHPYNFVCVADIAGGIDAGLLQKAAADTLTEMRLGAIEFGAGRRYSFNPVTFVEVRQIDDVDRDAETELNRPFDDGAPVRVALAPVKPGGTEAISTVSITFRHLAFDGHSASVFARRTLLRAVGADIPRIDIGANQRGRLFLSDGYAWLNPQFYFRVVRDFWRMRDVYSRPARGTGPAVSIRFLRQDDQLLTRVRRIADGPGVTVNDILAARFARGLLAIHKSELTAERHTVGLSLAVSLRRGVAPLARGIGVAAFPVFVNEGDDLIAVIRRQTDIEKRSRSYLRSLIGIGVAATLWPAGREGAAGPAPHTAYMPTAGFTNVRVPSLPRDEYIRNVRGVVSTGPVLPMMLVAVTHADSLRLALTWQSERYAVDEIDTLESTLTE